MQTLQEVSLQNTSKQAPKFAQNLKKDKVMRHKVLEQESQSHFLESPFPFPQSLLYCHYLDFSETIQITRQTIFSGNREPGTLYTETI